MLLDLLILIALGAAIAVFVGAPARLSALIATGINLVLGLALYIACRGKTPDADGYYFSSKLPILSNPDFSWARGLDGLSLIMVLLTVIVSFCAIWVCKKREQGERLLYGGCLLISAGALGAFVSLDLLFFYAFHELALIPTFLLIGTQGFGGQEPRQRAAWKITIYLALGSLVLLVALLALVNQLSASSGISFDMRELIAGGQNLSAQAQGNLFIFLAIGFGILVSLFPFHSWAAPAYAAAPTPVSMLHAGVLKKFGLYGLLRLAVPLLPAAAQSTWQINLLCWLLLGNIIIIGLVTIASKRLDEMLANSSVMHMGYIFLGVICFNALGSGGAALLIFGHGLSIALLFALCGELRENNGSLRFADLSANKAALGKGPIFMLCFALAAFASIGLPAFANFAGESMVFLGAFRDFKPSAGFDRLQLTCIVAIWGVVISAVYMLRAFRSLFQGANLFSEEQQIAQEDQNRQATNASAFEVATREWFVPASILSAGLLLVGVMPKNLSQLLTSNTSDTFNTPKEPATSTVRPAVQVLAPTSIDLSREPQSQEQAPAKSQHSSKANH